MFTITIAGTAGRRNDAEKLGPGIYSRMEEIAGSLVRKISSGSLFPDYCLVSGGAAWADHLAVRLFLAAVATNLTLHLPCPWDRENKKFLDTGDFNWKTNPGGTANALHRAFSRKTGIDSLGEIDSALKSKLCESTVSKGFYARNKKMAESNALIAFTFGDGPTVKDGGTKHMCQMFLGRSGCARPDNTYHVDLNRYPPEVFAGLNVR